MHKILNNKTKKYDNIILLGETCETGWQYTRNIGDPESNLFNWVRINNKNRFLEALKKPDIITKGEIEKNYDWGMFTDYNSGCVFHSTKHAEEMQYEDGSYNEEMWEEELVKLKSRNSHMIEKLKNIYKNDESKLFIYKAQECNIEKREEYYDFFTKLYEILKAKTNNNFDLLIIVLQKDYEFFNSKFDEEYKNLYIRTLKKFTPGGQAVSEELSDNYGWKLIYEEFRPKRFHKGKKYKFDSNENKGNVIVSCVEKIFSVKNEWIHNVVTIFGIKFKFKNKKFNGDIFLQNEIYFNDERIYENKEDIIFNIIGKNNEIRLNSFSGGGILNFDLRYIENSKIVFGKNNFISPWAKVTISSYNHPGCKYQQGRVFIGDNNTFNGALQIQVCDSPNAPIIIGNNNLFAPNVLLKGISDHLVYDNTTMETLNKEVGIEIGNHNWVAEGVLFLNKAKILSDCVIGTRSIVNKSFTESNCIIAGSPALIRKRNINWDISVQDKLINKVK